MPGLSQLKQFDKDILSLGDEVSLRAARGEKPVIVPIPKTIKDIDDSEEFVMGMPEIEAIVQDNSADDDLSDLMEITGGAKDEDSKKKEDDAPSFQAPDLSSLLSPIAPAGDDDGGMPDLSMFMEPEEPEIVEEEAEPEPPSIADMSLDDLLGGAGFDGSSVEEIEQTQDQTTSTNEEEFYTGGFGDENYVPQKREPPKLTTKADALDLGDADVSALGLDDFSADSEQESPGAALSLEELGLGGLDNSTPGDALDIESLDEPEELGDLGSVEDLGDLGEIEAPEDLSGDLGSTADDLGDLGADLGDLGTVEEAPAPADDALSDLGDLGTADDALGDLGADLGDLGDLSMPDDLGADLGSTADALDDLSLPDDLGASTDDDLADLGDLSADLGDLDSTEETPAPAEDALGDIDTNLDDLDNLGADLGDLGATTDDALADLGDLGADLGDLEVTEEPPAPADDAAPAEETFNIENELGDLGGLADDLGTDISADLGADLGDLGAATDDFSEPADTTEDAPELNEGFGSSDFGAAAGLDDLDFGSATPAGETPDISEEVPDFGLDDLGSADASSENADDMDVPIEDFDTSEMEGITFDIPETDTQFSPEESGFELGNDQDFTIEGQEFEIPGFSDVETAKEERSGPLLPKAGDKKRGDKEEEDLPPNTLSDSQYKQFLKNLSEYPLNVRLAFEDLIVKNEFTDDAEFEVIEKILNKSSARSVASMLEKMLDISIPVPRDFEHRTAEEYEAYKKSLQYQLKNKIIPGIFAAMLMLVVGWGLFQFGKNCIYIPAKANSLYKQGYAMLEADEYPQSEINYNEAKKYKLSKKWSFKYARGYRDHKQYLRAEWMYQNILNYFKHDKEAGLEYARMELDDLANYERAEEICRREILDYHINDADGILLLGDIFLEWGTEKDPEMLEKAREQYATLIQLYKSNNLYQSRMMRYFIRTDNLRNVLQLKEAFLPKEKNLSAEDWTELSGYLMDKLYGPLPPSEEYLRTEIQDVRMMLLRAVKLDPNNPIATYNLSRYFIETNEPNAAKDTLSTTIDNFKNSSRLRKRDIYKYIDSYRLLGEQYSNAEEYLRAQEYYTNGISLYTAERDASGFEGTPQIGVLFADQANIDYFVSGDFDNALQNYISSVDLENDTPSIRYRIGYIQYQKKNYAEALGSFMKAGDGNIKETNLLLAMANTLSLRGDNYAAQGYYEDLIANLDKQIADKGIVLPQTGQEDYDIVTTYLHAANNYGVTLYRLASRTGNSSFNAEAIVQLSQSVRAWDALTRNQETLVRLGGSNLAEENIKYITHPIPEFEPAIYTEIPRILLNTERF